jgi:hypothetical protein
MLLIFRKELARSANELRRTLDVCRGVIECIKSIGFCWFTTLFIVTIYLEVFNAGQEHLVTRYATIYGATLVLDISSKQPKLSIKLTRTNRDRICRYSSKRGKDGTGWIDVDSRFLRNQIKQRCEVLALKRDAKMGWWRYCHKNGTE